MSRKISRDEETILALTRRCVKLENEIKALTRDSEQYSRRWREELELHNKTKEKHGKLADTCIRLRNWGKDATDRLLLAGLIKEDERLKVMKEFKMSEGEKDAVTKRLENGQDTQEVATNDTN